MCSLVHPYNLKVLVEVFAVLKGQRGTHSQCSQSLTMQSISLCVTEKIKFMNGQMTDAKGGYPQASEFKLIPLIHIP